MNKSVEMFNSILLNIRTVMPERRTFSYKISIIGAPEGVAQ